MEDIKKGRVFNMVMFRSNMPSTLTEHEKFLAVGLNTGNMIFTHALQKNMHVDTMPYHDFLKSTQIQNITDAVLLTDLIWITENADFSYLIEQLNEIQKPFIPISVGVQNGLNNINYRLNNSVKRALEMIQERAVIGVRGEITADILNKNGIKNIQIIGCPSMYYWSHPKYKIYKDNASNLVKTAFNFRTFYGRLSKNEAHFLSYCVTRKYDFIEQTEYPLVEKMCPSSEYYKYVFPTINQHRNIFFSAEKWKEYMKSFDFSIGARFHGNVVALWNGIPALFIVIDSRMKEMLEYFSLPYISMNDFDETKDIGYYYDLANYEKFNKNYAKCFNNYIDFLQKNNIMY